MSKRSQNLKDVKYYEEATYVLLAAVAGEQNEANFHGSFTFVAGFWEAGTLGTNQSQSPTIGASREDLRSAERRGLETIAEQGATWPWCQKVGASAPRSVGGERGEKV